MASATSSSFACRTASQLGNRCFSVANARPLVLSVVFWLRSVRTWSGCRLGAIGRPGCASIGLQASPLPSNLLQDGQSCLAASQISRCASPGCPALCAAPRSPPPAGPAAASSGASHAPPPAARQPHDTPRRLGPARQGRAQRMLVPQACCVSRWLLIKCESYPATRSGQRGALSEGRRQAASGGGRRRRRRRWCAAPAAQTWTSRISIARPSIRCKARTLSTLLDGGTAASGRQDYLPDHLRSHLQTLWP